MKKSSIILLITIAAIIGILFASFGSVSSYETFASATEKHGEKIMVMGVLDTTQTLDYNPKVDANKFLFHATDKDGKSMQVVFHGTKPQDFERSESLMMTGMVKDNVFHCEKIQMKCPSKYEEDQVIVAKEPIAG